MEPNNQISIIISSRELDRKNPGDLNKLLSSLKKSLYNINNIEVIFKFDDDDYLIENKLVEAVSNNPEINIKYFFSPKYGYLGLHKAYIEALEIIDFNSYIIIIVADDFSFTENSNWDKELLEKTNLLKTEPFLVQDATKIGEMHDIPVFSKKIIELVGIGNSLSVDSWLVDLCKTYLEFNLNDYIITLPEFTQRQLCKFDFSHERWNVEREQLMQYLDSKEYKNSLEINKNKIKEYFSK
jgi:hypothetical protein